MKFLLSLLVSISVFSSIPKTELVTNKIDFYDDLDFDNMQLAIKRHLDYFNRTSTLDTEFTLGTTKYTRKDLKESLLRFSHLISKAQLCATGLPMDLCMSFFSNTVNDEFNVYTSLPKQGERGFATKEAKYTAYYSPKLHGSKVKTAVYKNAIYAKPSSEKLRRMTREQIEFEGKLAGKGLEIFYVKDSLYDIWLLHVEGGGVVEVEQEDGSKKIHYISYDGTNGHNFSMLSSYMVDRGYLTPSTRGVRYQRNYITQNPDKEREIISSCKSYIYFKETKTEPLGVKNIPLTMNRSMATDRRLYKEYGLLTYVSINSNKDANDQKSAQIKVNRFFINQDTGGYIRGAARADLYMGYGKDAAFYANNVNHLGKQYFIILKK